MARKSQQGNKAALRVQTIEILQSLPLDSTSLDLRTVVLSTVSAFHKLRDLGASLIDEKISSGKYRMLHFLKKYPRKVISGDELMVVSGINDWPRRLRELRVEEGWNIINGETAKELIDDGDSSFETIDRIASLTDDDYILLSDVPDENLAKRWKLANSIRRRDVSIQEKILSFLQENVGMPVTAEELRYVSKDKSEWARRVRELRTEEGWPIVTPTSGATDLPLGTYMLEEIRQAEPHDRKISDSVRIKVLDRDQHRCVRCGWSYKDAHAGDPRKMLELHHKVAHADKGGNTVENLVTLCNVDHDDIHRLKISVEDFLQQN